MQTQIAHPGNPRFFNRLGSLVLDSAEMLAQLEIQDRYIERIPTSTRPTQQDRAINEARATGGGPDAELIAGVSNNGLLLAVAGVIAGVLLLQAVK